jgi:hypothetical protein
MWNDDDREFQAMRNGGNMLKNGRELCPKEF